MSSVALIVGVAGAGASVYSANKAAKAAQAGQRDLGGEIGGIIGQLPGANAAGLATQQQYGGQYNAIGNSNLAQGVLGTPTFNAQAAFGAMSPEDQAEVTAQAQATGRTPQQWLNDHTMEQRNSGDPLASRMWENYGGYQGGLGETLGVLQGQQDRQNAASSTFQRTNNLADMQALAPGAANLQRQLNPELYGSFNALDASARAAGTPGSAGTAFLGAAQQNSNATPLSFDNFNPQSVGVGYNPQSVAAERVSNELSTPQGPNAIEAALEKQALGELALGDQLSADEARQVRVQSRAAADARGRGFSNAALADEVLNTANARQSRLDSRRGFAGSANTMLRSGQAADRGFSLARDQFRAGVDTTNAGMSLNAAQFNSGMGLSAAQLASDNARFNSGLGLSAAQLNSGNRLSAANFNAGRTDADRAALAAAAGYEQGLSTDAFGRQLAATQARGQFAFDPTSVLGQVDNRLNSQTTLGMGQQQFQGAPDYLGMLLGYGQDVNSNNSNARVAGGINSANAYASMGGGLLSAAGSIGSAYMQNRNKAA